MNSKSFCIYFGLLLILLIAAAVRLHALTKYPYVLDECWWSEIVTGHGSLHQDLPVNRIIAPPPFYSLNTAQPWWHIWSHMEVTYPPLYPISLRLWETIFGTSDYLGRLFSVSASLVAIVLLFDIVRLQTRPGLALWAALLMALASPQIEHAQQVRGYMLLTVFALAAVDMVVRIEIFGSSTRRLILLASAVLATLLTHYFSIGAMLGLMVYALWRIPNSRRNLFISFACAGLLFAILWGPSMWQQRHLFATDDANIGYLIDKADHHISASLLRVALSPSQMLFAQDRQSVTRILAMIGGIALCCIPFLPGKPVKNHVTQLWAIWMLGIIVVIASLDLYRGTQHLAYLRYILLMGPAVYALIPILFAQMIPGRLAVHFAIGIVAVGCALHAQDNYDRLQPNLQEPVGDLVAKPGPQDLMLFAADSQDMVISRSQLLMFSRYLNPSQCPVAILTRPASSDILRAAQHSRYVFISMQQDELQKYLPGAKLIRARAYPAFGIWTVDMNPIPKPEAPVAETQSHLPHQTSQTATD